MTANENDVFEREVYIAARPETVFPFFTDPAKMIQWKGVEASLDPQPGGTYRVRVAGKDVALGEYVALEPPHRIVFTWGWEDTGGEKRIAPGSSTVEVTLEPDGAGTRLRLRHHGLPLPALKPHAEGWKHFLPRLEIAAAGGNPGPDPWAERGDE